MRLPLSFNSIQNLPDQHPAIVPTHTRFPTRDNANHAPSQKRLGQNDTERLTISVSV